LPGWGGIPRDNGDFGDQADRGPRQARIWLAGVEDNLPPLQRFGFIKPLVVALEGKRMKKLLTIAVVLVFCACFAAAQTPGTTQPSPATQANTQVEKFTLEFANATSAKIAWTSKGGGDTDLHYTTDRNNLQQGAVGAVEKMNGDNHRATITNLQPNTTYFVVVTNKTGVPVGPVYSFKTPAQGQPPIHEQALTPQ